MHAVLYELSMLRGGDAGHLKNQHMIVVIFQSEGELEITTRLREGIYDCSIIRTVTI